jgi:hypothetical protein
MTGFNSRKWLATLTLMVLTAPSSHAAKRPPIDINSRHCAPASAAKVTSLSQAAKAVVCAVTDRRLLIVGEIHGSNEAPDLVASLVRDALPTRTVRLGLEMQRSEQAPLDAYLQSAGSAADQAMFLKSPFWSMQDGRSSTAMLRLIDTARALRAEGANLEVFAMEPDYGDQAAIASAGGPQKFKESSMAQAIQRAVDKSDSRQLVIALMGNFHARYGSDNPPSLKLGPSVVDRLASERPYVVLPFARTNATWNCQQDGCAVHTYTSTNAPKGDLPQFVSDSAEPKGPAVVRLWLPKITAALPAGKATP